MWFLPIGWAPGAVATSVLLTRRIGYLANARFAKHFASLGVEYLVAYFNERISRV
jgi:hypothetical protein